MRKPKKVQSLATKRGRYVDISISAMVLAPQSSCWLVSSMLEESILLDTYAFALAHLCLGGWVSHVICESHNLLRGGDDVPCRPHRFDLTMQHLMILFPYAPPRPHARPVDSLEWTRAEADPKSSFSTATRPWKACVCASRPAKTARPR